MEDLHILQNIFGSRPEQGKKQLFNKYINAGYSVATRYLNNSMDAEEATSDAFLKCFEHIQGFQWNGEKSLWWWLRRIIINECLMRIRKQQHTFEDIEQVSLYLPAHQINNDALASMSVKEILELIGQLPTGYRTVFNLFCMEGYSHAEIAAALGISESTSRTQLLKARKELQELVNNNQKMMHHGL